MTLGGKTQTKADSIRIVAAKEGPCIACLVWAKTAAHPFFVTEGCDYHHLKSGNVRRGHQFGIGLCGYHHRRLVDFGSTHKEMRAHYGPSLMDGSRLFRETYGSDDELLAIQNDILQGNTND